jgi:hypothetical protein
VGNTRLKSSFIYLANAVNDLRGNWTTLALVLAPLVLIAALCLLPDALNLQHGLATRFEPGVRNVVYSACYLPAQVPYAPRAREHVAPLFPGWLLDVFHIVFFLLTYIVNLVVLCTIRRFQAGGRHPRILNEAIGIYRESFHLAPAFFWVAILQLLATAIGFVLLIIPGPIAIIWLYFSQYALVFDGLHSVPALFHSRDLMRKRFFKVATRVIVFLAVWSGYNSWVGGAFFAFSLLLGPIGALTGTLSIAVFALDLAAAAVGFATSAFFIAAGVRLYQDLSQIAAAETTLNGAVVLPPTAPLPSITA